MHTPREYLKKRLSFERKDKNKQPPTTDEQSTTEDGAETPRTPRESILKTPREFLKKRLSFERKNKDTTKMGNMLRKMSFSRDKKKAATSTEQQCDDEPPTLDPGFKITLKNPLPEPTAALPESSVHMHEVSAAAESREPATHEVEDSSSVTAAPVPPAMAAPLIDEEECRLIADEVTHLAISTAISLVEKEEAAQAAQAAAQEVVEAALAHAAALEAAELEMAAEMEMLAAMEAAEMEAAAEGLRMEEDAKLEDVAQLPAATPAEASLVAEVVAPPSPMPSAMPPSPAKSSPRRGSPQAVETEIYEVYDEETIFVKEAAAPVTPAAEAHAPPSDLCTALRACLAH